jgi:hypothetical protein
VFLVVGGKGGCVERDGQVVSPADLEKRIAMSRGEFT